MFILLPQNWERNSRTSYTFFGLFSSQKPISCWSGKVIQSYWDYY